jgi:multicomponent Na+:H+ antiporter subunit A
MRRSVILTLSARALTPVLLLVSIFVTFRGHNAPGGGFAGGLIMGAAVVLLYLAEGMPAVRRLRLDPVLLIAAGLGVAVATTAAPLLFGANVMDSQIWHLDVPVIGDVKFVTAAVFDIGVHILVVGVVVAILLAFAQADDEASGVTQ